MAGKEGKRMDVDYMQSSMRQTTNTQENTKIRNTRKENRTNLKTTDQCVHHHQLQIRKNIGQRQRACRT